MHDSQQDRKGDRRDSGAPPRLQPPWLARLRTRLLLLVLIAVLPTVALLAVLIVLHQRQGLDAAREQALLLARILVQEHAADSESARQLLATLGQIPSVQHADTPACSRLFAQLRQRNPRYLNLAAIHPNGEVYCSAEPLEGKVNLGDRMQFRRAVATREFTMGEYQIGRIVPRPMVVMAYPLLDESGRVQAVLHAALDLTWLGERLTAAPLPQGSALMLLDARGVVLARQPAVPGMVGQPLPALHPVRGALLESGETTLQGEGADGVERLYAVAPMGTGSEPRAFLSVGVPTEFAFAESRRLLFAALAGLGLVTVLVFALTWVGADAFVIRRIQRLLEATRRLEGGDLSARTGIARHGGEIEQLAAAFDDMAETLASRHDLMLRAQQALSESESRLRAIVEAEPECVKIVDAEGRLVHMNAAGLAMLGAESIERLRGRLLAEIVVPEQRETYRAFAESVLRGNRGSFEYEVTTLEGERRWFESHAVPLRDPETGAQQMLTVTRDITAQKSAQDELNFLVHHDRLTGLPNRALFADRLSQAMIDADRHERMVGVAFLDLDRFKNINDTLGHAAGDEMLKAVAERLTGAIRKGDTLARLSGDEFAIVLGDMGHVDDAARVAQKILDAFVEPFRISGREFHITASLGITLYPFDVRDVDGLLRNADTAMYRAKEAGRNSYRFYAAEMTAKVAESLALEAELRRALERNELMLHYQPIVACSDGGIVAMEALLRWQHPGRGLVAPAEFIPHAEETGLIVRIGERVLRTACAQCQAWRQNGHSALRVAVNLSARQFRQPDLLRMIRKVLEETALDPSGLELEITESILISHDTEVLNVMHELSELGVSLSVDDFGTGYSSLGYLKRFPIDTLKIDRSFTRDIPADADAAAIALAIVSMAHTLGLKVVGEGVETREQLEFLRAHGCDRAQGYFLGRPAAAGEFSRLLALHRTN